MAERKRLNEEQRKEHKEFRQQRRAARGRKYQPLEG